MNNDAQPGVGAPSFAKLHLSRTRLSALRRLALFASTSSLLFAVQGSAALAACTFVPAPGDTMFVCDSGTSIGGLTDLSGNNTLTLPSGGTGTINGDVNFGNGADTIEMHSGTVNGSIDQGDGNDTFNMSAGTITGTLQQGDGLDDFRMTGGQIDKLLQGGHHDTFFMSGGRIVDAFDDGDNAVMTGGRIGRVNLKLDDNYFNMSGGTIDKNLVAGFGNDTIILSSGTIGGNISLSGGADSLTITGGTLGGNVMLSVGTDSFTWADGGIIYGTIDMGGDDDTATFRNLTTANHGAVATISGGTGTDSLMLDNVKATGIARLINWETIAATNDTQLTFDGTLTLGDSGTGTGALTVDATSTLFGGGSNGAVNPFTAGQLASLTNAGRIDLTNNGGGAGDTFTVTGNYIGNGGVLFVDTVLGNDSSASDRLVISNGTASGSTYIKVTNAGGTGATTVANGIMLVEAANGATTTAGAFSLSGRVTVGAYEYLLFKGGTSGGTEENWYLRSTMAAAPAPGPAPSAPTPEPKAQAPQAAPPPPPPSELPPVAVPTEGDPLTPPDDSATPPVMAGDPSPVAPPAPPSAAPPAPPPAIEAITLVSNPAADLPAPNPARLVGGTIPLYRPEVPAFVSTLPVAHYLTVSTLGTFHERRGEQALVEGAGLLPTSWARLYGQDAELTSTGTLTPTFDGTLLGIQAGLDLIGWESGNGHHDRIGLFYGYSRMRGDINSPTLGGIDAKFGEIEANGNSIGATWTHVGPGGWYADGVVMGTWLGGESSTATGEAIDIDGNGIAVSLEGGYPIALTPDWVIEPQAQLIWHSLSLNDQADSYSSIRYDADNGVTGRVGFRLKGNVVAGTTTLQPYLKANIWHEFGGEDHVSFDTTSILSDQGGTSLEVGGGITAKLSDTVSLFASADYTTNLGGEKKRVFEGNLGLSVKW
ncbi:autotransporter outer membrane beta-barrel domain-containing protein [Mesorhizobium sp. NBSH29]|uniref:autotransporter family protein n=1 Tax=Mesorhizobium sp. NBSH29 TaxID=2654249 RepID=UPI0018966BB7|nr:autotransporter outer membrane beta-barrel domain-containing protein [Mesorhizobium sp. NBSH29]QPC85563.1 autotransporter outer membrane beta-barrel domain-containing protein [Mesorhizobium sp. NBSH29]